MPKLLGKLKDIQASGGMYTLSTFCFCGFQALELLAQIPELLQIVVGNGASKWLVELCPLPTPRLLREMVIGLSTSTPFPSIAAL